MTGQTSFGGQQYRARAPRSLLSSRTRRIAAVAGLALALAVPSGYAVERAASPAASSSQVRTSAPLSAPLGVPHWKFVEENQMPEAPATAAAPAAPPAPATSRFQEINQMPEAPQPIIQPSGPR